MTSSLGSVLPGFDYPVTIGLAIPVTWKPSGVRKEEELERHRYPETKARSISQDGDSPVTSLCPISNDTSDRGSNYQDPHPMVPIDHIDSDSDRAHDENLTPCSTQEGLNFTSKPITQQGEIDQFTPLPCASTSLWIGIEAECFLLGLYIFGKNPSLLSRFVGNKTIGDVLSYYYGKFYKRDAYRRWSDCRKAGTRRCILGKHIFTSWRQQEIISRLKSVILNEAHDSLVEIFKSFNDGQTYLEDFVFALKSTVGTEALVEAVGIGKDCLSEENLAGRGEVAGKHGGTAAGGSSAGGAAKEEEEEEPPAFQPRKRRALRKVTSGASARQPSSSGEAPGKGAAGKAAQRPAAAKRPRTAPSPSP